MTRQELKFVLENGGLVKDSNGKWMKHGDKVEFDADMLTWYVSGDEWTHLGWGWEEVYEIIKV